MVDRDIPRSDSTPAKRRSMRGSIARGPRSCRTAQSASCWRSAPYARRVFSAMPRARSAASKVARSAPHLPSLPMGSFFIDVQDGRVATARQLAEAGLVDDADAPVEPWHPIQGPRDASTMWYAVMRKRTRGIFIGTLCIRHTGRQASLAEEGWEEVAVSEIRV